MAGLLVDFRPNWYLSGRPFGNGFQDEETNMRCVICKAGETTPGTVTVTLQRGDTVVIIRDVPAAVCRNCGEYYLDEVVSCKLYRQGEEAVLRHAEVEILRYAA
jgi:YgiT-type zinc finger domain-containing protein